jgi:hypothetical protein
MSETQLRELFARHADTDEPPLTAGFVERSVDAGRRSLRRRRAVRAATGGVAAVVALAIGVTVLSTLGEPPPTRPGQPQAVAEPRDAADLLGRISLAAARQRPDIRDDQFIHEKRHFVTRMPIPKDGNPYTDLTGDSERWTSVDGTRPGWHILPGKDGRTVSQPWPAGTRPSLMDPTYRYLTTLPTDPDALLAQIYTAAVARTNGSAFERDQLAFELVGNLLNNAMLPPDLGAALYKAAAKIPGVTLIADATDVAGRHGIAVGRKGTTVKRSATWIFDKKTYDFLGASVHRQPTKGDDVTSNGYTNYAILSREVVDEIPR